MLPACSDSEPVLEETDSVAAIEARTIRVEPGSWLRSIKSFGLVTPAEEYKIGVEVSSTVEEVLFREGQDVQVGDVLLRLNDKKLRLKLDGIRASMEEARANHDEAKSTHDRNLSIYKSGVISEQTYLKSEARLKSTAANLRRAVSSYDIAREELADAELKSPVSGVVTHRDIEIGQNVSPVDRLGVIRVTGALQVESYVSQKDINHIEVGMTAVITSPGAPGQTFDGVVDQVASSAEIATGNFEVGVVLEDPNRLLRDGMSAMVEFRGQPQQNVLAVPRTALIDRGRKLIVYRVVDDMAQAVEPALGVGNAESVPVFDGLNIGDEIIVSNLRLVSEGQLIKRSGNKQES